MARLFSIDIPFENKHYTALVSVKEHGPDLYCTVRYIEKDLRHILSGDQLVISLKDGLKQPCHLPSELAHNLFQCTAQVLNQHLEHRA
ncbi:hypothetical protein SAMN05444008_10318 [Cnuella takakiae]|uniref:Uncharacterized protein n=1 Tax=Cnuella takakiae TaxID=1302690 RepID=A0A1M4WFX4_9BACT|nr:hypothetical protein [Cnuella takakiae]OLY91725.1 hypothetical protein BUE76_07300 [Cnuella takakiae]SHE80201.1 hypothetical protein SAMN05444008_10318 [Cnuella takakiae]